MIDPVYLFVLEDGTEVWEEGQGELRAERVAVTDYYGGHWLPPDRNRPAFKAHGANGRVYIPETDVEYIVDLSVDEFRPIPREAVEGA